MFSNKVKDAAGQIKALATSYKAVIDFADCLDELAQAEGYLGELTNLIDTKKAEVANAEAAVAARQAVLSDVENKVIELEDRASVIIEEAKRNAAAIERTATFDGKTITDAAREEAAMIVKAAKDEAAGFVKRSALAKAALKEWDKAIELRKGDLEAINGKIENAKAAIKAAFGE